MKLASFLRQDGASSFGVLRTNDTEETVLDLGIASNGEYSSLKHLLADPKGLEFARFVSESGHSNALRLSDVRLLPVIPDPSKIFCVGVNYASHVKETGREMPVKPMIFTRFAESQIGAGEDLIRPKVSEQFDFEGELAVIIGRRSRYVSAEEAPDRIAGYSCYNDASVRDWQRHSGQFTPGKNFPGTGAFGPWMVTRDALPDLAAQTLTTRLNGTVVQSAGLDDLIFDVAALVSYCSHFSTLEPGDVIITGTTGGVGAFRTPQLWMKPGDTVEVEISGIGILRNGVAGEAAEFRI